MGQGTTAMMPLEEVPASGIESAGELWEMGKTAERFLLQHKWCRRIKAGWLERGIAGILAVFYFEIEPINADADLWAIVGDIPPACLDVETCPTGDAAPATYVAILREWIETVRSGGSVEGLMPVCYADSARPLEPTLETVDMLESRLDSIESDLIPWFREGPWEIET